MNKKLVMGSLLFLVFITGTVSAAATAIATKAALQKSPDTAQLDRQIKQLQQEIQHDKGKKGLLSKQLQGNNAKLIQLEKKLAKLQSELKKQHNTLGSLQKEQAVDQQKITHQQQQLSSQLTQAYQVFCGTPIEESTWIYYGYLLQNQVQQLGNFQHQIADLTTKQHQTLHHQTAIQGVLSQQQKTQLQLAQAEHNQQQVLDQLSTQIQSNNAKLTQLKADRAALNHLVNKLQKAQQTAVTVSHASSANSGVNPPVVATMPVGIPFGQLQNKLPWPTLGKVVTQFGSPIGDSGLKNTGILLAANDGQAVRSIDGGRVVFANWLQGLGLLLIIDHGNGYMSLYGHNHTLYKKAGDVVRGQELIATVGSNGENAPYGLYFEIRHNGQPVNPLIWLGAKARV